MASIAERDPDEVVERLRQCKQYLIGDLPNGPFRPFHKSFADFLLEDEGNADYHIDAKTTHARIADHYWGKTPESPDWTKCDDYGLAHLAVHLYRAEQSRPARETHQPRLDAGTVEHPGEGARGFIADLELAWRATLRDEKIIDTTIVKSLRYALIRTSFNSTFADYPPSLVARALVEGLWTAERVFGLAASLRESQTVALWAGVLSTGRLDVTSRSRAERLALDGAGAIEDPVRRVRAYTELAETLDGPPKLRALEESSQATNNVSNPRDYVDAVIKLAPLLAAEQKAQLLLKALMMVKEVRYKKGSDDDHSWARSSAIVDLSPHLSADLAERALEVASDLSDAGARAAAQAALLRRLPEQSQEAVIGQVLDVIRGYLDSWRKRSNVAIDEPHDIAPPPFAVARVSGNPQRRECVQLIRKWRPS